MTFNYIDLQTDCGSHWQPVTLSCHRQSLGRTWVSAREGQVSNVQVSASQVEPHLTAYRPLRHAVAQPGSPGGNEVGAGRIVC